VLGPFVVAVCLTAFWFEVECHWVLLVLTQLYRISVNFLLRVVCLFIMVAPVWQLHLCDACHAVTIRTTTNSN
jgi:hypothetical protein